jgi:hypothetical protein
VGNDLLVTNCPILLGLRDEQILQSANIMRADEASKIVGLLFRHRDHIALRRFRLDGRWGFYLALTKVRVPELNHYWGACVYSERQRKDDVMQLGQSINVRLHRALKLRRRDRLSGLPAAESGLKSSSLCRLGRGFANSSGGGPTKKRLTSVAAATAPMTRSAARV